MRAFADEAFLHHQQAVDRFLNAGGTQRMAGERLGRLDMRDLVAEDFPDRADFLAVANRRRGAVGIDVVDIALDGGKRLLHAADRAFA
ncbi:hypothetical protein D3C86_1176250 [compost metagenome]